MQAGKLRHLLTLEQPSETTGNAVVSWNTVAEVHGDVQGLVGSETSGLRADAEYRVRLRFRSDVTPKMRLNFGGKKLGIISAVDPDGRRRELVILATQIV
jgi:SPP1 family predicted phage head-tail adaptor